MRPLDATKLEKGQRVHVKHPAGWACDGTLVTKYHALSESTTWGVDLDLKTMIPNPADGYHPTPGNGLHGLNNRLREETGRWINPEYFYELPLRDRVNALWDGALAP